MKRHVLLSLNLMANTNQCHGVFSTKTEALKAWKFYQEKETSLNFYFTEEVEYYDNQTQTVRDANNDRAPKTERKTSRFPF